MRRIVYFILAFIIWIFLTWPFSKGTVDRQMLIAGAITAVIAALLFHEMLPKEHMVLFSPIRMFWLVVYLPVFFVYVVKAALIVVYRNLHPQILIKPGIVKIKTSLKTESGITALANSITLTPGTLTIDVTDDGYLYIHWSRVKATDIDEATKIIARKYEWFLKRIFE
jgi:multicomponent Na+:H+ antiporter subunit E